MTTRRDRAYEGDIIGARNVPSDVGTLFDVRCCDRDTDGDGNCDIHIERGVFRKAALRDATTAHERQNDPIESAIAAEKATRGLTEKRRAVLHAHCLRGGMTDDELIRYYNQFDGGRRESMRWPMQTASSLRTRRSELRDDGYLEKIGEGTSDAGGISAVWGLTAKGKAWRAANVAGISARA